MTPPAQLTWLLAKYRKLARLRARAISGDTPAERAELRALADEYPGALRELSRMPTEEIERRAAALSLALGGGPSEAWMEWMAGYHQIMRIALLLRRRRVLGLTPEAARELAASKQATRATLDAAFVAAVSAPLRGRLNVVVFAKLSDVFAVAPGELAEALFPSYD